MSGTSTTPLQRAALRITGAVALAAPALLATYAGGAYFALWVALFATVMLAEWHAIVYRPRDVPLLALQLGGIYAGIALTAVGRVDFALPAVAVTAALGAALAHARRLEVTFGALGCLYVGLPVVVLVWLERAASPMPAVMFWLFAVVWATDTAALLAGRAIGGPKLAPRVSPGKTWAGLAGGVCAAALVGALWPLFVPGTSAFTLAIVSAVLAVLAQLGDLTESAFKRHFGVKDSGRLIPGQGGLLDRVDGLVFASLALAALALARDGDVLFLGARGL